jgi:hypothetical protein
MWQKIQNFSDLISFANMKEMQEDDMVSTMAQDLAKRHLSDNDAHKTLLDELVKKELDPMKVFSRQNADAMHDAMKAQIVAYFKGIKQKLVDALEAEAKNFKMPKRLIEKYQKVLEEASDHKAFDLGLGAQAAIQCEKTRATKLYGERELNDEAQRILREMKQRGQQKMEKNEAERRFEDAWQKMKKSRVTAFNFEETNKKLLDNVKELYTAKVRTFGADVDAIRQSCQGDVTQGVEDARARSEDLSKADVGMDRLIERLTKQLEYPEVEMDQGKYRVFDDDKPPDCGLPYIAETRFTERSL